MTLLNKTISDFTDKFEKQFSSFLISPLKYSKQPNKNLEPVTFNNFTILLPEKKYSDWDLFYWFDSNLVSIQTVKDVENFIRSYEGFKNVGVLITTADKYLHLWHNTRRPAFENSTALDSLPFMAFMPNETQHPFFDLHISGINNHILQEYYNDKTDDELIDWLMLTIWRKYKNGATTEEVTKMVKNYLSQSFPTEEQDILNNPSEFFKKYLSNKIQSDIINFLDS